MRRSLGALLLLLLSGCPEMQAGRTNASNPRVASAQSGADPVPVVATPRPRALGGDPGSPIVVQLDVYQLTVPFGALSRNDEFWKRVDETRIDPATYDLLVKNGVRIGIGDNDDWSYFKSLIDQYHAVGTQGTATPVREGKIEIALKGGVDLQDLFYFDDQNVLYGRTYEKCDNLLAVDFIASRRVEGDTFLKICPVVRGLRKRFEVSVLNEEREISLVRPEQIIDLRLQTDVPFDHFLIMGPSRVAKWPTSLGQTFLVGNSHAGVNETVLLIVPHAYRVGASFRPANIVK